MPLLMQQGMSWGVVCVEQTVFKVVTKTAGMAATNASTHGYSLYLRNNSKQFLCQTELQMMVYTEVNQQIRQHL